MAGASAERTFESPRGTLRAQQVGGGLLRITIAGHYGEVLLAPCLEALNTALRAGRVVGFLDWEGMTSYDSVCRQKMTDWCIANQDRIDSIHILLKSRLVAMGVSTASLIIGRGMLTSYTDRAKFEAARRARLRA